MADLFAADRIFTGTVPEVRSIRAFGSRRSAAAMPTSLVPYGRD